MANTSSNSIGAIGFIFACLGAVFCWLPILGGLFWLIGAVFSCIGLGYRNNGLAWCGFWISLAWIICYFIFGLIFSTFTYLTIYPLYIW
jgi:hypothetical protein